VHGFRDGFSLCVGGEVKDVLEELKSRLDSDLILTHERHDLHQDHRLVCELTWNTWRDHLILEYEIPKYDGDLGTPNVFVPVSEDLVRDKARLVLDAFESQRENHRFTEELFLGLMRIRGWRDGRRADTPRRSRAASTCF
jgi:LmbE family N-acetylglucosaminyl deacetylase